MKRIYVLTFHRSVNYGAVLQAYALSKRIHDFGYECEVIDYNRKTHHKNFLKFKRSSIRGMAYQLIQYPEKYRLHKKFEHFSKRKINMTKKCYNGYGALQSIDYGSDAIYIVGSDQVWNCRLTENDMHYFLDFVKSYNKYSYAASFGITDISDWECMDKVIQLLKKFRKISVREESGSLILKKYCNISPEVVCDPTFLITQKEWGKIAKIPKAKRYILLFMLNKNEELIEAAKEMAGKRKLIIFNIAYSVKNISDVKDVSCVGPEEWLGYIKNAECVFTNSFHGFALSLNFNKQVWVALSTDGRNSRILDLAKRYEVLDRIVRNKVGDCEINYEKVNKKIQADRLQSLHFLEGILNEP